MTTTPLIYLIVDPSLPAIELLAKLANALEAEVYAVQVWDNFTESEPDLELMTAINRLCQRFNVPVIVNNHWQLINQSLAQGVHFDEPPVDWEHIDTQINVPYIKGITCQNNLDTVHWAATNGFSYLSFCSLFPSATDTSCELVEFDTIRKAREITDMPIFLAGGIRPERMPELSELPYSGVAVVSGIMNAENPMKAVQHYRSHANLPV